jgi:hypothetical protein
MTNQEKQTWSLARKLFNASKRERDKQFSPLIDQRSFDELTESVKAVYYAVAQCAEKEVMKRLKKGKSK